MEEINAAIMPHQPPLIKVVRDLIQTAAPSLHPRLFFHRSDVQI